ncbi:antitoxin [Xylanimonas allomyrinae]|uniref:Antitoxin n=1 Tax=Xylanimonas allomyrinae TaxID=2509459 RepID=A0A4P6ENG8_9MICO|nr:antitoxin [Xylanimonas allomyrinae]QAY62869.1 antitoxin [Xylanimonas allomyrinae]
MTAGAMGRETVKLSASLPAADVAYLERYARRHRLPSRSATLHAAVQALRERELETQYAEAYREWEESGEAAIWDATAADGIEPVA